jgi:SOS-response transcriptional repressor LexA
MLKRLSPKELEIMFDRIEARLKEMGLTLSTFQNKLNIQSQHWSNWKRRGIPPARYSDIARILGRSVEWLTTGKDDHKQDLSNNNVRRLHTDAVGKVPVIKMGKINLWHNNEIAPSDYLSCPVQHGARTFAAIIDGNQMISPQPGHKSYPEGSIIFVDPDVPIKSGARVIALIPGSDIEIFREFRREGGVNYLIPFNPQYKTIETQEDITFLGSVIAHLMQE